MARWYIKPEPDICNVQARTYDICLPLGRITNRDSDAVIAAVRTITSPITILVSPKKPDYVQRQASRTNFNVVTIQFRSID